MNVFLNRVISIKTLLIYICLLTACVPNQKQKSAMETRYQSDYTQGQQLFLQKKYHNAYPYLLKASQKGNTNAIYAIGYMMYYGLGIKRDQTKALVWFQYAASKGNINATQALQNLQSKSKKEAYNLN